MIILGNAGLNYHISFRDRRIKEDISQFPITLFCIHGNQEENPMNISNYKHRYFEKYGCECWYEEEYPNILFPFNGVITLRGKKCLVVGGCDNGDDERYRLDMGVNWSPAQQLTEKEKEEILTKLEENNSFAYIFTHTAPLNYEPKHIHKTTTNKSMPEFLQMVHDKVSFKRWYFAHYHDDRDLSNGFTLLYKSFRELF